MSRINCIFCGGITRTVQPLYSEPENGAPREQVGTVMCCYKCGLRFDYYSYPKPAQKQEEQQQPLKCSLSIQCPEFNKCEQKDDAEKCATYRAVVMRKLKISK